MSARTCKTCRFWEGREYGGNGCYACRRRAPVACDYKIAGRQSEWPKTYGHEWCGEWEQPKEADA